MTVCPIFTNVDTNSVQCNYFNKTPPPRDFYRLTVGTCLASHIASLPPVNHWPKLITNKIKLKRKQKPIITVSPALKKTEKIRRDYKLEPNRE